MITKQQHAVPITPSYKPNFIGPPFKSNQFQSYIDSGTFVSYVDGGVSCFGRIISTAKLSSNLITINQFTEIGTFCDQVNDHTVTVFA